MALQPPGRVRTRCLGCRAQFELTEEQFRELQKQLHVAVVCPHCNTHFIWDAVRGLLRTEEASPRTAWQPAPDKPPPPFAPLIDRAPGTGPPPFAPLTGSAQQPPPPPAMPGVERRPGASPALGAKWKRMAPWKQWAIVGVLILLVGVVIFALPFGNQPAPSTEPQAPPSTEATAPSPTSPASEPKDKPGATTREPVKPSPE